MASATILNQFDKLLHSYTDVNNSVKYIIINLATNSLNILKFYVLTKRYTSKVSSH